VTHILRFLEPEDEASLAAIVGPAEDDRLRKGLSER
jgi:hypothetical protein